MKNNIRRVGAIDIGTNSFLCLVADIENGKVVNTVSDSVQIVRLGEGVHKSREFTPEALSRADSCLKDFRKILDKYGVERVQAVATSAARDVKNSGTLFKIGRDLKIPITVISGPKEAELTYKGVITNPQFGDDIAVIDVGGGSTEVTTQNSEKVVSGQSFDLGGVRLTEMFVTNHPISKTELAKLRSYAKEKLSVLPKLKNKTLVGVAGTPTTIAALEQKIDYTQESIEGYLLTVQKLEEWILKLADLNLEERSQLKGLEPKRADIIVAGAAILLETTLALGGAKILVSTRGVRYGLASELGT